MSKSMLNQLLDVVRKIVSSTIEEVIRFAEGATSKLSLDALKGLARAVAIYLERKERELLPNERQNLRTFCKKAVCDSQTLTTFYKEVQPVFA